MDELKRPGCASSCFEQPGTLGRDTAPINAEGYVLNPNYDPAKDLSVDKFDEKGNLRYYHLMDPKNPGRQVAVLKEHGYIDGDGRFRYFHPYKPVG